jgi:hypothetical protein
MHPVREALAELHDAVLAHLDADHPAGRRLSNALDGSRAALALPAPEPVAWRMIHPTWKEWILTNNEPDAERWPRHMVTVAPLYAEPPAPREPPMVPGLPSEYHGRHVQFNLDGKHYTLYEVGTPGAINAFAAFSTEAWRKEALHWRTVATDAAPSEIARDAAPATREPTTEMLQVDVTHALCGKLLSGCVLGEVWRKMYDAAAPSEIARDAARILLQQIVVYDSGAIGIQRPDGGAIYYYTGGSDTIGKQVALKWRDARDAAIEQEEK